MKKIHKMVRFKIVKLVCGWMDGWMDGWVDVKAVLKIAYSNKKIQ
jgi:hypothetical protein